VTGSIPIFAAALKGCAGALVIPRRLAAGIGCAKQKFYSAVTEESVRAALEEFRKTWEGKYPMICQSWDRRWDDLSEFFK